MARNVANTAGPELLAEWEMRDPVRNWEARLVDEGVLSEEMLEQVNILVQRRLEELTPQMVKEIMQQMIRDHLGWLVVWGGVFGGLIGFVTSWIPFF